MKISCQLCVLVTILVVMLSGCKPTKPAPDTANTRKETKATTCPTNASTPQQKQMLTQASDPSAPVSHDLHAQLEALGYMGGYETATSTDGVVTIVPDKVSPGDNLVVSGHTAEVYLMASTGDILHRWTCPRNRAFPDNPRTESDKKTRSFRRAYLVPGRSDPGHLIGIYNGTGMVRLDAESHIIWTVDDLCHHDLDFSEDGAKIFTFIQNQRLYPSINKTESVMDEEIATIDSESGRILHRISLLDAFQGSVYSPLLKKIPASGDVLHANTIHCVTRNEAQQLSFLEVGDLLISLRNMDAIAVYRSSRQRIVWAMTGLWLAQHEPSILANGNFLLFDNVGENGHSKVIEFNPLTQEIAWQYDGTHDQPLFSTTSGTCHRLSTGNTLIVESNRGRAIEVTLEGEIVWEFMNPGRWGSDKRLRGTLFDVQRVNPSM